MKSLEENHIKLRKKYIDILKYGTSLKWQYLEYFKNNSNSNDYNEFLEKLKTIEEWQRFENRRDLAYKDLMNFYRNYLMENCKSKFKKDKIIILKRAFTSAKEDDIAEAIGCSIGYIKQLQITKNKVRYRFQYRRDKRITNEIRQKVLERDEQTCVWCKSKDKLCIHHIVPLRSSRTSDSNMDNLALLCEECHLLAHGGNFSGSTIYANNKNLFWEWQKNQTKIHEAIIDIKGVGQAIVLKIIIKFKTYERFKKATLRELADVPYINESLAKQIKSRLDELC